jgi:hypothetical protein
VPGRSCFAHVSGYASSRWEQDRDRLVDFGLAGMPALVAARFVGPRPEVAGAIDSLVEAHPPARAGKACLALCTWPGFPNGLKELGLSVEPPGQKEFSVSTLVRPPGDLTVPANKPGTGFTLHGSDQQGIPERVARTPLGTGAGLKDIVVFEVARRKRSRSSRLG